MLLTRGRKLVPVAFLVFTLEAPAAWVSALTVRLTGSPERK